MVVVFCFGLLTIVWAFAKSNLRCSAGLVFALTAYFFAAREFIEFFFTLPFSTPLSKFSVYTGIVVFPLFLLVRGGSLRPSQALLSSVVAYLLILPLSRPTLWFARLMGQWKLSVLEIGSRISDGYRCRAGHWYDAPQNFRKSRDVGRLLADELEKILKSADVDQNGHLSEREIRSMIDNRK
jgi:hypothetical protein